MHCSALPGDGDRRKQLIEDIAVLTGANALTEELGRSLASVNFGDLGTAEKVIVAKNETTLIGGGGSAAAIEERARIIRSQIDGFSSGMDREKLQERLAMLVGGIAILRVGGLTDADVAEERYKMESALHSTRAAIEYGYLLGGGVTLLRAGMALADESRGTSELEVEVKQSVISVLEVPIRQLIQNSKRSPTQIVADIQKS